MYKYVGVDTQENTYAGSYIRAGSLQQQIKTIIRMTVNNRVVDMSLLKCKRHSVMANAIHDQRLTREHSVSAPYHCGSSTHPYIPRHPVSMSNTHRIPTRNTHIRNLQAPCRHDKSCTEFQPVKIRRHAHRHPVSVINTHRIPTWCTGTL